MNGACVYLDKPSFWKKRPRTNMGPFGDHITTGSEPYYEIALQEIPAPYFARSSFTDAKRIFVDSLTPAANPSNLLMNSLRACNTSAKRRSCSSASQKL